VLYLVPVKRNTSAHKAWCEVSSPQNTPKALWEALERIVAQAPGAGLDTWSPLHDISVSG